MVVCAFGFGIGGLGLGRVVCAFWVWSRWVGVGRSWLVLEGLGLVGWSVVVCACGFGVGGLVGRRSVQGCPRFKLCWPSLLAVGGLPLVGDGWSVSCSGLCFEVWSWCSVAPSWSHVGPC